MTRLLLLVSLVLAASCKSDDKPAVDAAPAVDAPPNLCAGGTVGYLGVCTDTAQCGSCSCQPFAHNSICTITCTGNEGCPAPSAGCSNGGYCRP